jgi:hypothetical protein
MAAAERVPAAPAELVEYVKQRVAAFIADA